MADIKRMKRQFIDAPQDARCQVTITLKDGSKAQCGKRKAVNDLCTQHARIAAWTPYLKDGETVTERLARYHTEVADLMGNLATCKAKQEQAIRAAVAEEREACARVAASYRDRHARAMVHFANRDRSAYDYHADRMVTGADIAEAIRARGDHE